MNAKQDKQDFINYWNTQMTELLHERNNLSQDDLEYLVSKIENMKDERLKYCITTLIGWGDAERSQIETFVYVALQVMKDVNPSRIREVVKKVELQSLLVHHLPEKKDGN